jgi:uncharacterized integral membrane protein
MKLAAVRFYLMIAVSGLILLAAVVLVVLQWGNQVKELSLYGKNVPCPTWLLMLASAVGGLVAWAMIKVLWRGIAGLRRLRRSAQAPAGQGGVS